MSKEPTPRYKVVKTFLHRIQVYGTYNYDEL